VIFERSDNPLLFDVLTLLETDHDQIALINTSFNGRGEPIVHSEQDAAASARALGLDALCINHTISFPSPMKVLLTIHGYPPRYNAGSEIYTQTLARALTREGHEVQVFCRMEDPFQPDYVVKQERDASNPGVIVHLVNFPRSNARFRDLDMDHAFESILEDFKPDVVHFGHLKYVHVVPLAKGA
jgi:hypothetical protein